MEKEEGRGREGMRERERGCWRRSPLFCFSEYQRMSHLHTQVELELAFNFVYIGKLFVGA